ncbi:hypothetical protein [Ureibacillus manganicus]|nr:hypothetical protein [Ureibacillus manganicus]
MSKSKEKQKPMPPFNNKTSTTTYDEFPEHKVEPQKSQTTVKSLEDFANEVFDQLNRKSNQSRDVFTKQKYKDVPVQPKVDLPISKNIETPVVKRNVGNRPSLDENRSSNRNNKPVFNDVIKQTEIGSYVPKTKQALIQAIVASEIIGPPKAKQR